MFVLALLSSVILSCSGGPVAQQEVIPHDKASKLLVTDYALDISTSLPYSVFQCFHQNDYRRIFIRVYHPYGQGQADQNAVSNIEAPIPVRAITGLGTEAYMVPEPKSNKTGTVQFDEMYNNLRNSFIYLNSIWIQVSSASNWLSTPSANIAFLNDILLRASLVGLKVGIYTNNDDWTQITGGARINNAMLWYYVNGAGPSNMSAADFNDFTPFGGWTAPSVKQFVQGDQLCDVTVNRNIFDIQTPVGINKEKSNHIANGSLDVNSSTLIRRAEIIP